MKSWQSKLSLALVLSSACTGLNSCKLFGGGEYSSQVEVETEVPESLDRGAASSGPPANPSAYAANTGAGVPEDSNLVEVPELPSTTASLPMPGDTTGGASMTGMPAGGYDRVEIPRPDFGAINMQNSASRPPAEMLSLGPPTTGTTPRMALNEDIASHTYTSKVEEEKPEPAAAAAVPTEAELATAPAAIKDPKPAAAETKPGVPLLYSATRLADYYQNLHNTVLTGAVAENTAPPADPGSEPPPPPAAADDLSVPPPPPAGEEAAPPPPPQ